MDSQISADVCRYPEDAVDHAIIIDTPITAHCPLDPSRHAQSRHELSRHTPSCLQLATLFEEFDVLVIGHHSVRNLLGLGLGLEEVFVFDSKSENRDRAVEAVESVPEARAV